MDRETQMFVEYFRKKYGINVDLESAEVGWESVTLYHEEIDDDLLSNKKRENLPDPLLFLITGHIDEEEHEWIFGLIVDDEDPSKWYSAYCLKDGEIFDTEIQFEKYLD